MISWYMGITSVCHADKSDLSSDEVVCNKKTWT